LFYYLDKGADVVEMEASALCALAKYRKVEMAQMFIISDSLARGIWEPYFEQEILRNSLKEAGISLLQFLAMVDQKG
jgi:purine-nucleoside phosphorylase